MVRNGSYKNGRPVYMLMAAVPPFLKSRGKPGPFRVSDLAVAAGRALLLRQPFHPEELDEVLLGCGMAGLCIGGGQGGAMLIERH
jgi:acetyl-CoA C-acetyltransferase